MSAIIMRSALVFHGKNPAPDVAYIECDGRHRRVVTWEEVLAARREKQRQILQRKRTPWPPEPRAHRLWVAYFDQEIYGGWHCFLENLQERHWVRRNDVILPERIMELFPLVLPLGERRDQFEDWMTAFARQYRRGTHHRRPRGVAYVWWDGGTELRRIGQEKRTKKLMTEK